MNERRRRQCSRQKETKALAKRRFVMELGSLNFVKKFARRLKILQALQSNTQEYAMQ